MELKEDEASVVEAMLRFMYQFDYDSSGSDQARVSPLIFNVKVYSIADKYDVPALKLQAKGKFEDAAETCWNMDDFPHAITEIYASIPATDRGLSDPVVEIACKNINPLLEKQDFRDVLKNSAGFAADVTQLMAGGVGSAYKKYRCPNCGQHWEAVLSPGRSYYCTLCGSSRSDWERYGK
jgi:speckle-type POZ protein